MPPKLVTMVLAASLLMVGCEKLPTSENKAKSAIREMLFDPESAQFSDLFVNSAGGASCGWVNGKNRMGGYVGKVPFYFRPNGEALIVSEPPSNNDFESYYHSTGTAAVEKYKEVAARCREIPDWEEVCGRKLATKAVAFCVLLINSDSRTFVKALHEEFKR